MSTSATAALEDISEEKAKEAETEAKGKESSVNRNARREARQRAAVKELYVHETMALAWCFVFPVLGTYLLHTIRGQLSRPSEGLVSDYNLTIFLCAAELRPVSHLFRMLRRRTLHIQNIVAQNPHSQRLVTNDQIQALYDRLGELEAREAPKEQPLSNGVEPEVPQKLVESAVVREFRRTAQPELEALNRAMRRYEKKLTLLAGQTDDRMEYLEHRLNDAIALVAVAAKSGRSEWGLAGWLVEKTIIMIMLPFQALATVLTLPFRTASTLFYRKGQTGPEKAHRPQRNGKSPVQGKGSSDRMPTRMSRR
ncbi:hypothetical protein NUW58_g9232 [Xylaria curta]|uniref:Uncharacterized protein n=1 Tax=Xylaria curta TaxID=42375 RepID=A0ACC1N0R8_9PEZI|nr:hypothetical protein NUW58_g9232 [Xylaria curta]